VAKQVCHVEQLENKANSRTWREEQRYGYIAIMIVQIVLMIVTAVQVNSQQLCDSVCQCDGDNATCINLFSAATGTTQQRFNSSLWYLKVNGSSDLQLEKDLFLCWNITSLTFLDLSQNNIKNIRQRAFYSLLHLQNLDLYGNRIISLHSQTFYFNTGLVRLSLAKNGIRDIHNSITDIHIYPSAFQTNTELFDLDMSRTKLFRCINTHFMTT